MVLFNHHARKREDNEAGKHLLQGLGRVIAV